MDLEPLSSLRIGRLLTFLPQKCYESGMSKTVVGLIFAAIMAAIIVTVDISLFRHHATARLLVNMGIVSIGAATYLRFFKR